MCVAFWLSLQGTGFYLCELLLGSNAGAGLAGNGLCIWHQMAFGSHVVSTNGMSWGVLAYCNKICKLGGLWWMLILAWNTLLYVICCCSDM